MYYEVKIIQACFRDEQCLNTPTSSEMDLLPYFSIWLACDDVFNAQQAG